MWNGRQEPIERIRDSIHYAARPLLSSPGGIQGFVGDALSVHLRLPPAGSRRGQFIACGTLVGHGLLPQGLDTITRYVQREALELVVVALP